jgi:hypothetical protein
LVRWQRIRREVGWLAALVGQPLPTPRLIRGPRFRMYAAACANSRETIDLDLGGRHADRVGERGSGVGQRVAAKATCVCWRGWPIAPIGRGGTKIVVSS